MPQDQEIAELIADAREQVLYLQELGVEALSVELPAAVPKAKRDRLSRPAMDTANDSYEMPEHHSVAPRESSTLPNAHSRPPTNPGGTDRRAAGSRLAVLPSLTKRTPATLPVENAAIAQGPPLKPPLEPPAAAEASMFGDISPTLSETSETIESIRAEIGDCTRCSLHKLGRKQIVHSTGNFNADLMFVGEAPGGDEDEQGFPFVGRAGQLLTKIIEGIGLKREEVFIGNINRCRPPGNRAPEPDETAACRPFILKEIAVVKPKVIVVLGATAAHNLLQVKTPISKLRGSFHDYFGVKVMPTFHPAYLLRDPNKKREVWEDMKKVRDFLNSK